MNKTLLSTFTLISVLTAAHAQTTVASFDFQSSDFTSSDAETSWATSDLNIVNIDETAAFQDPVITGSFGNPAPSFEFNMTNISDAEENYIEFTVTPDSGVTLDFTSLTLDFYKDSGGADVNADVTWSVDGFASSIGGGTVSTNDVWTQMLDTTDISGLADQAAATTFRISLDTTGSNNLLYFDNVVLAANVSVVPEPSAFALLAGMFGLTWVMIRRRG